MRRAFGPQLSRRQVAADELEIQPNALGGRLQLRSQVARGVQVRSYQQNSAGQLAIFGRQFRQWAEEVVREAARGREDADFASTREATPQLVLNSPFEDREPVAHSAVQGIAVEGSLRKRLLRWLVVDVPHHTRRVAIAQEGASWRTQRKQRLAPRAIEESTQQETDQNRIGQHAPRNAAASHRPVQSSRANRIAGCRRALGCERLRSGGQD